VHRVVDVDEHGRLIEQARAVAAVPTGDGASSLGDRVLDVAIDGVDLRREGDGADLDAPRSTGDSLPQGPHLAGYLAHELVVHGFLDIGALDRDAGLARVLH